MKKLIFLFVISISILGCKSLKDVNDLGTSSKIETKIDLTRVIDDKVPVEINPGRFTENTITYRIPKVIQGSYAVGDFGRFIDTFKAYDYKGNELGFEKVDTNTWKIFNGKQLDRITYYVNDTFDLENTDRAIPFSPGGTNISPDNYVLNLHGFIGYFDSLKNNQYTLQVTYPTEFKYATALNEIQNSITNINKAVSVFSANRYFDITDNPIMYGNIEVETFNVGDISIVLSVYSPNKVHSAKSIKETVFKMMEAQKKYLGELDSTSRYDIFLYLSDLESKTTPRGFGALEHHKSTVVVLEEQSTAEELAESMIDVVSHEFFHIVTPLSLHSEDVHYFDYANPTLSKHLWLYEGVVEYFSHHFQVYEGLINEQDFYNRIMEKVEIARYFDDDMSFITMSENVLEEPYATNYYNVYEKGALIGMCLDVLIRENSKGNRSLLSVMKELSTKYGQNKPFKDDLIISELVEMTYPEIDTFFTNHIIGETPINYEEILEKVGLEYAEQPVKTDYLFIDSQPIVSMNPFSQKFYFTEAVLENSFWKAQGVLPKDVIKSIDGVKLSISNVNNVLKGVFEWKPGREIKVVLLRNEKEILIATITTQAYTNGLSIGPIKNATADQIKIRNAWLKD
jgi:predicted metalloprotease with PDZ domain